MHNPVKETAVSVTENQEQQKRREALGLKPEPKGPAEELC